MATNIISVLLSFRENLSKNINPAITALNKFDARTEQLRNSMMGISAISGGFLVGASAAAISFSGGLKELTKTTGLTGKELEDFANKAKDLSAQLDFQIGSSEILNLAASAAKLGVETEGIDSFVSGIVRFGTATDNLGDLDKLSTNIAKLNNSFGMSQGDLDEYLASLNKLANTTAVNATELTNYAQQSANVAASQGLSAKSSAAFGATLMALNQQSGQAATMMRNFGNRLSAATNLSKPAQATLKGLGYDLNQLEKDFNANSEGTMIKFLERLKQLEQERPEKLNGVLQQIFGEDSQSGAAALVGNLDMLKKNLAAVGDTSGNAALMTQEFAVSSEGLDGAMRALKNITEGLAIEIGTSLLPGIISVTKAFLEFVKPILAFVRQNPAIGKTIAVLLGITAVVAPLLGVAGAISSLLALIPSLITGFTAVAALFSGGLIAAFVGVAAPIAGVIAGVTALGLAAKAIYDNWGGISKWFSDLWNQISLTVVGKAMQIKTDLENWGRNTAASIKNIGAEWYKAGQGLIGSFVDGIKSQYSNARDSVSNFTQGIRDFLPGSDAKRGALSDLTNSGMAFADTFMKGVQQRGLAGELNNLFSGYNSNATGIPNLGGGNQGLTTAPVTITYNITARDSDEILKKLKERDRELLQLINQSSNRINRTAY